MRRSLWAVAAGAAVVVALAVAIAVLPGSGADATPDPSPTSLYRSAPELLPPGAYVVDQLFERPITLEVPANWTGLGQGRGYALIVKTRDAQPFGEVGPTVLLGIYAIDSGVRGPVPRHGHRPLEAPPSSVAFVAALTHAVGRPGGADRRHDRRGASRHGVRPAQHDRHRRMSKQPFSQWSFRAESGVGHGNGTSSGGATSGSGSLDVDGTIILIDADSGDDSFTDDVEELYQIVESIRFE